jgi:hypothetical protein
MTVFELYVIELEKRYGNNVTLDDVVKFVMFFRPSTKGLRPILTRHRSKTFFKKFKNINMKTPAFNRLRKMLWPAWSYFSSQSKKDLPFSANWAVIKFFCWWAYHHYDPKTVGKSSPEKITGFFTPVLISKFKSWYDQHQVNTTTIILFEEGCKKFAKYRRYPKEPIVSLIKYLIDNDMIAQLYYSGELNDVVLATFPDEIFEYAEKSPKALFSKQTFRLIKHNQDLILNKLNFAFKNVFRDTPNAVQYIETKC